MRCAIEVQNGMVERNAGPPPERRVEFRVGIHLDDVVEESDGDLMGDGVNIAARLEGSRRPATFAFPRTPIGRSGTSQVKSLSILAIIARRTLRGRSGSTRSRPARQTRHW